MTKKALLDKLRRLAKSDDTEGGHVNADAALLAYINDPDVSEAYHAIDKWYA